MRRLPGLNPIDPKHSQTGANTVKFQTPFFYAIRLAAAAAACLNLAGARADAGLYPQTRAALEARIPSILPQTNIVGLSIALIDDQNVVWSQGFGYADKAKGIKADGDTIYRAGSISKLFTATAAMQLAEQGKFDIDAPIQAYVPQFSIKTRFADAEPITPRLLMTHHSGLPTDYFKGWFTDASFSEMVESLHDDYVSFPPKLIMSYSNLGISLLGTAIENACGKPFESCLDEGLLQPLGMSHAAFAHGESPSPLMSKGYAQGQEAPEAILRDIPAGGLNASVLELARFAQMVFAKGVSSGQPVLSEASLAEMFRPQNDGVPLDFGAQIGLAWVLDRSPTGELSAFHDGGIGTFHSLLIILPQKKLGVVVLSNSKDSEQAVGEIAGTALQLMAAEQSGAMGPALPGSGEQAGAKASVNDYPGHYAAGFGIIQIKRHGKSLSMRVNGARAPIKLLADGRFGATLPIYGDVVLNRTSVAGHPLLLADTPAGPKLIGERVVPRVLSSAWRKRVGTYIVQNPDAYQPDLQLTLSNRKGFLILSNSELGARILIPVSDTEAVMAGLGRALGETVVADGDAGDAVLRYSGYRFKRR